ncbi:MAG: carbohydrate ABC transporter permease [Oscillospiraceae bacterium]|jgi:putative aldouronate transport system permease protein|nr:carbohydrate ABC transporter permease [Oscillospiraceae bacterium]
MKIKHSFGERLFDWLNVAFFLLTTVLILFPFYNMIVITLTSNAEFMRRPFILFPEQPTLEAYRYIFSTALIPRAYMITITVTVCGTILSTLITSMLAYGLSKRALHGQKFFMVYLLITMFFSGGLIPSYYNISKTLNLGNTLFALFLPGTVNVFNFVIIRSFFMQLPASMEESARIDGANDLQILFRIIYPLSIATLATIALFVAVGLWNSWFSAQLYMRSERLYPLQLVIRNYVVRNAKPADMQNMEGLRDASGMRIYLNDSGVKLACAVVSAVPLLLIYPFIQRYFEKGVTIGAIKG